MLEIRQQLQVLYFNGELNRETVAAHWPFKPLQALSGEVRFDLGEVRHVDTAGLAWLLQVLAQARAQSVSVRLSAVPEQLKSLAAVSDVLTLLPADS